MHYVEEILWNSLLAQAHVQMENDEQDAMMLELGLLNAVSKNPHQPLSFEPSGLYEGAMAEDALTKMEDKFVYGKSAEFQTALWEEFERYQKVHGNFLGLSLDGLRRSYEQLIEQNVKDEHDRALYRRSLNNGFIAADALIGYLADAVIQNMTTAQREAIAQSAVGKVMETGMEEIGKINMFAGAEIASVLDLHHSTLEGQIETFSGPRNLHVLEGEVNDDPRSCGYTTRMIYEACVGNRKQRELKGGTAFEDFLEHSVDCEACESLYRKWLEV